GHIDAEYFLGGRLDLDAGAARDAISREIAAPLGLSLEGAAWAMLAVWNEHMVTAIRDITISQGIDPRECLIVAGGGAGGLTIAQIATELGCKRVLIPQTSSALSACGGLFADIVTEFSASLQINTEEFDFERANAVIQGLEEEMQHFLDRIGVRDKERETQV